jgi:hypothetical protein
MSLCQTHDHRLHDMGHFYRVRGANLNDLAHGGIADDAESDTGRGGCHPQLPEWRVASTAAFPPMAHGTRPAGQLAAICHV